MRQMLGKGKHRIEEGISVLVFPEGTRNIEATKKYARGGAALAVESGAQLVLVAHNAGRYWPPHQFAKHPGTIQVSISEPIDSEGKTARELTQAAQQWIESKVNTMA